MPMTTSTSVVHACLSVCVAASGCASEHNNHVARLIGCLHALFLVSADVLAVCEACPPVQTSAACRRVHVLVGIAHARLRHAPTAPLALLHVL